MKLVKFISSSIIAASLCLGGFSPIVSNASEIVKTDTSVHDYSMIEEISNAKETLDGKTPKSAPVNTSKVKRFIIPPLIQATATSSSTVKEDYIEAKVRAYNDQGGLWGTKTDSAKKSSYAGATYDTGTKYISFAYGSHVYKLSGYKDVYHETSTK